MIRQFGPETALLLIDVQKGVNVFDHWGGPTGRRNNPGADDVMRKLLARWRDIGGTVAFTRHDSREPASPLKLSLPTGAMIEGFEPRAGEIVVTKDVNSAFIGTDLDAQFKARGITRLVVAGYFTNFCVETSVRMAGNMGYDTYLAHDACATCNRVGPDGTDRDPELLHDITVATLHGEFCTALTADQILGLTHADAPNIDRVQGNEDATPIPAGRSATG